MAFRKLCHMLFRKLIRPLTLIDFIVQKEKLYRAGKTTVSVLAFLIIFTNCSRKLASLLSGKFYHIGILERSIENKRLVE